MQYDVEVVTSGGGLDPPGAGSVENVINNMAGKGWEFVSLSSGGMCDQDSANTWVYLVFKKD